MAKNNYQKVATEENSAALTDANWSSFALRGFPILLLLGLVVYSPFVQATVFWQTDLVFTFVIIAIVVTFVASLIASMKRDDSQFYGRMLLTATYLLSNAFFTFFSIQLLLSASHLISHGEWLTVALVLMLATDFFGNTCYYARVFMDTYKNRYSPNSEWSRRWVKRLRIINKYTGYCFWTPNNAFQAFLGIYIMMGCTFSPASIAVILLGVTATASFSVFSTAITSEEDANYVPKASRVKKSVTTNLWYNILKSSCLVYSLLFFHIDLYIGFDNIYLAGAFILFMWADMLFVKITNRVEYVNTVRKIRIFELDSNTVVTDRPHDPRLKAYEKQKQKLPSPRKMASHSADSIDDQPISATSETLSTWRSCFNFLIDLLKSLVNYWGVDNTYLENSNHPQTATEERKPSSCDNDRPVPLSSAQKLPSGWRIQTWFHPRIPESPSYSIDSAYEGHQLSQYVDKSTNDTHIHLPNISLDRFYALNKDQWSTLDGTNITFSFEDRKTAFLNQAIFTPDEVKEHAFYYDTGTGKLCVGPKADRSANRDFGFESYQKAAQFYRANKKVIEEHNLKITVYHTDGANTYFSQESMAILGQTVEPEDNGDREAINQEEASKDNGDRETITLEKARQVGKQPNLIAEGSTYGLSRGCTYLTGGREWKIDGSQRRNFDSLAALRRAYPERNPDEELAPLLGDDTTYLSVAYGHCWHTFPENQVQTFYKHIRDNQLTYNTSVIAACNTQTSLDKLLSDTSTTLQAFAQEAANKVTNQNSNYTEFCLHVFTHDGGDPIQVHFAVLTQTESLKDLIEDELKHQLQACVIDAKERDKQQINSWITKAYHEHPRKVIWATNVMLFLSCMSILVTKIVVNQAAIQNNHSFQHIFKGDFSDLTQSDSGDCAMEWLMLTIFIIAFVGAYFETRNLRNTGNDLYHKSSSNHRHLFNEADFANKQRNSQPHLQNLEIKSTPFYSIK